MKRIFSIQLLPGVLVVFFCWVSFFFRTYFPHDQVFVGDWIKFTSIDAYYHMRIIDNFTYNFPYLTHIDPFFIYLSDIGVSGIHFFDWLAAGIAWIVGLGAPTQHTIDIVGVYYPPVLAALTVIPVYFIGKALFNRWVGVFAAGLVAILPGEYMGRSILGFTDYHVAETLFSTVAILFLILAVKSAGERRLTFSHFIKRDWKTVVRPLAFSLLASLFLGVYLITWQGGLLLVFIIALYFIIQHIINHLRNKSSDHLGIIGFFVILLAAIIFLPQSPTRSVSIPLIIALISPPVLTGISRLLSYKGIKPVYYPPILVGLGAIFLLVLYGINVGIFNAILSQFGIFSPSGSSATTTLEMQPFLSPQGIFSTSVAWGNYTTSFFLVPWWPIPGLGLLTLIFLIWLYAKKRIDDELLPLLFIWTLVMLAATLSQRRFAYYFVVNIAILSAYASWGIVWLVGLRKIPSRSDTAVETVKEDTKKEKRKAAKKPFVITVYHINTVIAVLFVFVFIFLFNIVKAKEVASAASFAPSNGWQASLVWMKENTPEPFGTDDAYYNLYEPLPPDEEFQYPDSAYSVTSWWDYGYWISRTAHRIPNVNPSQASEPIKKVANLLLSDNETMIKESMGELGSSYMVIDYAMATTKYWAIVTWTEESETKYIDVYYLPYEGELIPVRFFYPEYYNTLLVRLYNFGGEAVTDENPLVVSYEIKQDKQGNIIKQIVDFKEFTSYRDAQDYIAAQESGDYVIVGVSPFMSPVPLERSQDFKLVYSSEYGVSISEEEAVPEVRIFEYLK
ncbi:MAG: oligosaccharyl transferase, archaeosortase A system-associated [Dehalococcoidales bacterium]|nr:oligosaccharyl transferase, archaeosortase A system-associated [Dehalococcoidales bacterium]